MKAAHSNASSKHEVIAWTNLLDPSTQQVWKVSLYLDTLDILNWLGNKAIKSKRKQSRSLSGALVVKAVKN